MQHCNRYVYKEILSLSYRRHRKIFTDGSKQLAGVRASCDGRRDGAVFTSSGPVIATILPAELMAIRLALSYVAELEPDKVYLVYGLAQRDDLH